MGAGQSGALQSNHQESVLNAIRGTVLRASNKESPLTQFLASSVYSKFPIAPNRLSGLYVVSSGKEMENYALTRSLQPGKENTFIVRPLSREFVDNPKMFRKANESVETGATAVYSILATIIAITGLSLSSHTHSYKDLLEEVTRTSKHSEPDTKKESDNGKSFIDKIVTYSSQRFNDRNTNPEDRNVLFHVKKYPLVVNKIVSILTAKYIKKSHNNTPSLKGDSLFHTNIMRSIDSFAVCATNPKTKTTSIKDLLSSLSNKKSANLDAILAKISQILSNKFVQEWLQTHPNVQRRIRSIVGGIVRSARLIASDQTDFQDIILDIMDKMRDQIDNACSKNEALSTYVSNKRVLVKHPKEDKYHYSLEANRAIVRIYQRLESVVKKMQMDMLTAFESIFVVSKTPIPSTVSIKSSEGYLCLKPSIVSASDPGEVIANGFLRMVEVYGEFIVGMKRTLEATITPRTKLN